MKVEKRLIAYCKLLEVYKKSNNWFLTLFRDNQYERHITDWGLKSTLFIFGYDIEKLVELNKYQFHNKQTPRKLIISILKECINQLKQ